MSFHYELVDFDDDGGAVVVVTNTETGAAVLGFDGARRHP